MALFVVVEEDGDDTVFIGFEDEGGVEVRPGKNWEPHPDLKNSWRIEVPE